MLDSPCIILDRVSRRFEAKQALEQGTATIRPGEFVAIIGKSGAGKTTLLRCLACSIPVSEGSIRFGDQDLAALHGAALRLHRARVGMIYQQFNLVRRLRVLDNVLIGRLAYLSGWRRWAALGRYFDASQHEVELRCLDHVGLLDRVRQCTDTLSGGQQQRVAIAKILAQEPQVILADEPVASLDPVLAHGIMQYLEQINKEDGVTVLCSLHFLDLVHRYAGRAVALNQGRLVFDGAPQEIDDQRFKEIYGKEAERVG
jgi:phosphonate transport system ATP-binding protein